MAAIYENLRRWYILGLMLSMYALYVEHQAIHDKEYKALCDISPIISCTTVFKTTYGKTFGFVESLYGKEISKSLWNLPNGLIGIIYYTVFTMTTFYDKSKRLLYVIQMAGCIAANLISTYLAYLLYAVIENYCIICVSIYVVNIGTFRELWQIFGEIFVKKGKEKRKYRKKRH